MDIFLTFVEEQKPPRLFFKNPKLQTSLQTIPNIAKYKEMRNF